jgi:Grx4 family monothiol glutaredoxin
MASFAQAHTTNILEIKSGSEYEAVKASGKPSLLFFWALWQEESLTADLKGLVSALGEKYSSVQFCLIEAESFPTVSAIFDVKVVPTFIGICGASIVGRVEGANPPEVSKLAKVLSATTPAKATTSTAEGPSSTSSGLTSQMGTDVLPTKASLEDRLKALINTAPVMLFMKGAPDAPRCGFSRQIVEILREEGIEFSSFDILTDEEVRAGLKTYSDWPTYPQLYVKGELQGGLDIVKEMRQAGPLKAQFA